MSIGERITQIRKEQGLSQEGFGETLGVSRQSISKWEADQSIPDVEKLIAISRLYGVSIGWILGTEEERTTPGELSEEQLKMVEMIAEKYLSSIPPAEPHKKPSRAVRVAGCLLLAAVIVAGIAAYGKLRGIENRQQQLENTISYYQSSVSNQVGGIANRVEQILEQQNSLLAEYDAFYGEPDLYAGTIPFTATLIPKTYRSGMAVDFILDDGISSQVIPGIEEENHRFSAEMECQLTNDIRISAVLRDGQTEQTQLLQSWGSLLSDSKLYANFHTTLWMDSVQDVQKHGPEQLVALFPKETHFYSVVVKEVVFRVFVNGTLQMDVETQSGIPENYHGFDDRYGFYGTMPTDFLNDFQEGDTLLIAAVVTDNFGRTYVAGDERYVYENGRFEFGEFDIRGSEILSAVL